MTLESNLVVSQKVKHKFIIQSNNCIPSYLWKRNESECQHRDTGRNVHRSIIHNNPKLEIIQMSISCCMDKQNVVQLYNGIYSTAEMNKPLRHGKAWANLKQTMINESSQKKRTTQCIIPHMKLLEKPREQLKHYF